MDKLLSNNNHPVISGEKGLRGQFGITEGLYYIQCDQNSPFVLCCVVSAIVVL